MMTAGARGSVQVFKAEARPGARQFESLQASRLTRSFPWISAALALLCIAANASMFVGIARMNAALAGVAEGTADAANATIALLDVVEGERRGAQRAFNGAADATYGAVGAVAVRVVALRGGVLAKAEAFAATADTALRSAAVAGARALFDALDAALAALGAALQVLATQLTSALSFFC